MASKDKDTKDRDSDGVQRQRELLADGLGPEAGWCYDGDRNPEFFRCGEEEEAVARGDLSVSFDGKVVTDVKTGEVIKRDVVRAVTAPTLVNVAGAGATGADTTTTGGAAGGGGGRATA